MFVLAYLPDGVYSLIVPNFDKGTGNSITVPAYEIAWFFLVFFVFLRKFDRALSWLEMKQLIIRSEDNSSFYLNC